MKVGYARVSTRNQGESLETQETALRAEGCERVFSDTISGAKASRPGLEAALDFMRDDDVLVVTRLDRLGRTTLDTLRTIDDLAQRGVAVLLLDPKLDTRTKEGQLMVTIMSGLAQWERELLIDRTKEGVAHARAAGRIAGPKPKLSAEQVRLAGKSIDAGPAFRVIRRFWGHPERVSACRRVAARHQTRILIVTRFRGVGLIHLR